MLDLSLAIAHHLAVFSVVAIFAAEWVLLRPGLDDQGLRRLVIIDRAYGAVAGLIIVVGVLRVIYGASGWDYYAANWAFWAKMAAFGIVGLATVPPTIAIIGWARARKADPHYRVADGALMAQRRYLWVQLVAFAFIPAFAAAMARGYGV